MINALQAAILGLIQGLAEFLPISSSGHLTIASYIMGIDAEGEELLTFNILLHVATLIAVFAVYYKDVWGMIKAFFGMIADICRDKGFCFEKDEYRRLTVMLIIATIPAVFSALLFDDLIANPPIWLVGVFLYVTAIVLFISDRFQSGSYDFSTLSFPRAIGVGCFQAVAVLPGISRSGSTIVGGLFFGLKRQNAVRFSFLLSIPAILGALVMDIKDVFAMTEQTVAASSIIIGMVVAAVSGYFSIKLLLNIVRKSRLTYFSIYCVLAGTFAIILNFIK
ncbi:MAG: undecaprenyl-diphosphate phosphatase [Clostridia bacterium]|nr:undecaprenyl-diphosphate phosphatase [Clostridia bacterium]